MATASAASSEADPRRRRNPCRATVASSDACGRGRGPAADSSAFGASWASRSAPTSRIRSRLLLPSGAWRSAKEGTGTDDLRATPGEGPVMPFFS